MIKSMIFTKREYVGFVEDVAESLREKGSYIFVYCGENPFRFDVWKEDYDVGISFMYQHKVPAEQVSSHPWFNFHPAPLPDYKGRDLCYHAIMNGEKEFGATIHYMDEGFDTGPIIMVKEFMIQDGWTAEDLSDAAISHSKELFIAFLPRILRGEKFDGHPNVGGTYYKKGQIIEEVPVRPDDPFGQFVRAVSYKEHHPRIDIGGVKYEIRRIK